MHVMDLGQLEDAVLLFGGPYSNLPATRAVLTEAARRGIAPDHVICTGDVVAYCAEAAACVDEIRKAGCAVVAGNCEKQLAAGAMDCGCGFEEGSTCDLLSAGWYAHADAQIGATARAWMGGLPDVVAFEQAGRRVAVVHGGATDVSRFLWPTSPEGEFAEEIAALRDLVGEIDFVVAGHCGLAFLREIDGVTWLNAGVVGMPPNDGRPKIRFATLEGGVPVIHALSYDHEAAYAAMRAAGLTQGYDTGILSGYWPSEEVLPPELRRADFAKG
ncbi:metallophosphoesterase family protein [Roseovarius sp. A21]|uniref:Metallophosphoesterase family protein n=1 Tax=Roseovarius bejariae TaxID=2576383 RepID=A0A844CWK2_9RHOB|nr:metallophosphoesterase family protein [Roseovarius bejariae]MRU14003.1 metallophosphoesterase family protein [Roseovarius bejariae]